MVPLLQNIQEFTLCELNQIKDKSKTTSTENKFFQLRALLILILNKVNSSICFDYFDYAKHNSIFKQSKIGGQNNLKFLLFYELLSFFFENDSYPHNNKILNDLSCFFLTNIISSHKYCCEMDKQNWLYSITIFTTKFLSHQLDLPTIDPVVAIKCLRMILNKCYLYIGCFSLSRLFSFFSLAILNLK